MPIYSKTIYEITDSIYQKVKYDAKDFENREQTTLTKRHPNREELKALNEVAETLVTTAQTAQTAQFMRPLLRGKITQEKRNHQRPKQR